MTLHNINCQRSGFSGEHSDAAKKVSDQYRLHRLADPIGNLGGWIAVALNDGASDGVLYASRKDCVTHQRHNEMWYAYIQIIPSDMAPCDAEIFLAVHRRMYDKGIRLTDPDHRAGGRSMIPRVSAEDQRSQLSAIFNGGKPSNLIIPGRVENGRTSRSGRR